MNSPIRPYMLMLARAFMAAIFIIAGLAKIPAADAIQRYMESAHLAPSLFWPTVIFEVCCGLAVLVGYQSQRVAIALAGYCLITALFFHLNVSDQTQFIMLLKNIAMSGGFLYLASFGPGPVSIDARSMAAKAER